jgi:hypothetical protein
MRCHALCAVVKRSQVHSSASHERECTMRGAGSQSYSNKRESMASEPDLAIGNWTYGFDLNIHGDRS